MDPCPDGAQQCCAPATEWRRRDKPAATKARQKSTAPAREGMGPCPDGAQQCRARATEWRRRDKPAATNARQKTADKPAATNAREKSTAIPRLRSGQGNGCATKTETGRRREIHRAKTARSSAFLRSRGVECRPLLFHFRAATLRTLHFVLIVFCDG